MINNTAFEKTIDGKITKLFTLENKNGLKAAFTNFGARLVSLLVPAQGGNKIDIVAGFDSLDEYLRSTEFYYGAIIGRYCNRISNACFTLEGKIYHLSPNDGNNSLHGGVYGFHNAVWDFLQIDNQTLTFSYLSGDLEEGYPGNLKVQVSYQLTDDNELKIKYEATTDKTTVINLTNHAYFNLNGVSSGSILNHRVTIRADNYTLINKEQIPNGEIKSVKNTPFDFRRETTIGSRIWNDNEQLTIAGGYNHNFVLNRHVLKTPVARVTGDKSGLEMEVYTDQPGLQLYTANHMRGENLMRGGKRDEHRYYLALETQHFPDAINQPTFPSTVLAPGILFSSNTILKFRKGEC